MSQRPRMLTTPNGSAPTVNVAAPINDYQITALMAAMLCAHEPPPATAQERDVTASRAVIRAIDLLGHAAYQQGRSTIATTIARAIHAGQQSALKALEDEEARQRGDGATLAQEAIDAADEASHGPLLDEHGDPTGPT